MIIYKVTFLGPTDYLGARYSVANLQTGTRTIVHYDYSTGNPARSAAVSVARVPVTYGGEDSRSKYYVAQADG